MIASGARNFLPVSEPRKQRQTAEQGRGRRASRVISTGPGGQEPGTRGNRRATVPAPGPGPRREPLRARGHLWVGVARPSRPSGPSLFPRRQHSLPGAHGRGRWQLGSPDPGRRVAPRRTAEAGTRVTSRLTAAVLQESLKALQVKLLGPRGCAPTSFSD